jgi:hypothetical protein
MVVVPVVLDIARPLTGSIVTTAVFDELQVTTERKYVTPSDKFPWA